MRSWRLVTPQNLPHLSNGSVFTPLTSCSQSPSPILCTMDRLGLFSPDDHIAMQPQNVSDVEALRLQIFLDMAVLVEAQGELLDNIETQVGRNS